MAHIAGHSNGAQFVRVAPASADGTIGVGGPTPPTAMTDGMGTGIIDGTPVRVVVLVLAAAGGLWALKAGGVRFNVGVST